MSKPESGEVIIRPEIQAKLDMINRILKGDYGNEPIPDDLNPETTFFGPIIDMNDQSLTESEIPLLYRWLTEKLESSPDTAPISKTLRSSDGITEVNIYQ